MHVLFQHPMSNPLVEGEDYYLTPDGLFVFTAAYLLRRGYCCGNGCRHCPYPKTSVQATDTQAEQQSDSKKTVPNRQAWWLGDAP